MTLACQTCTHFSAEMSGKLMAIPEPVGARIVGECALYSTLLTGNPDRCPCMLREWKRTTRPTAVEFGKELRLQKGQSLRVTYTFPGPPTQEDADLSTYLARCEESVEDDAAIDTARFRNMRS